VLGEMLAMTDRKMGDITCEGEFAAIDFVAVRTLQGTSRVLKSLGVLAHGWAAT
jgi:hypothetical protein